jgi:8-oxo-dGTP diphosphatase
VLEVSQKHGWSPILLVGRCFVRRPDGKFLIVKRSPHDGHNPGKWEVPGGKVEAKESIANAQVSETFEETKLEVKLIRDFVGSYSYPIGNDRVYRAEFGVAEVIGDGRSVELSHEHADYRWVSYQQMLEYDLSSEVRAIANLAKRDLISTKNTSPSGQ